MFQFIELFAGIGGFRVALEELEGECVGYSEIDREAIAVYQRNFSKNIELGDVVEIKELLKNVDLITGGVPCQSWSIAGKSKGFDDPRGKLWFKVVEIVNSSKPKAFIFENVKGLSTPKHRESLEYILKLFEESNYCVKWKILNSYDFGVPQDRERVFIVGIRKDIKDCDKYTFPEPLKEKVKLLDIIRSDYIGCEFREKAKISPNILFGNSIPSSRNKFQKYDELNDFFIFSDVRNGHTTIHSWDLIETSAREKRICMALLKNRRRKRYGIKDGNPLSFKNFQEIIPEIEEEELKQLVDKKILKISAELKYDFVNSKVSSGINQIYRIFLPTSEILPTLTARGTKDFIATETIYADNPEEYKTLFLEKIYKKNKFRSITATDMRRLQGFPDWFIIHENENIAKKQFGNAVSVGVVYHVAKNLKKINLF